ncbi:hypothetical protein D1AOALGA4SA_12196 [Olavius algarvensis Delta 1 endosymbiont]|nr:hypothetical protein D1AOALGA4SA_12196 [Olavius algarvensis Delta 1 endosymbiont]
MTDDGGQKKEDRGFRLRIADCGFRSQMRDSFDCGLGVADCGFRSQMNRLRSPS